MIITTNKIMRSREANDFYPTPIELCTSALGLLSLQTFKPRIFDPGAGSGPWGQAARKLWPMAEIAGCDIRDLEYPPGYDIFSKNTDYLTTAWQTCDLVIGNPPYKFAEAFTRKALAMAPQVMFLLRLAFLEGGARGKGLWRQHPPRKVIVLSRRPSFITTGDKAGKTDATAYAIFYFQRGSESKPVIEWLDWKGSD